VIFWIFENWDILWGYIILIYKDIQCRWVKSCSRSVKAYNSCPSPPRAILTAARVGRYDHITPIYIPPYAVPPTTLILGSRIPGLQGSQGSRVTGHHGSQGHHGHGSYWVTGSLGYRVYYPRFLHGQGLHGHHGLGSRVTMGYHHPNHRVTGLSGHGSPWSQGYHHHGLGSYGYWVSGYGSQGHRVTGSPGSLSPWS
jgi:hypothetical protein